MAGRFIGYFRVSTQRQGRSGLGLEAQRKAVMEYVAGIGGELMAEYVEVESGKRTDRPQLAEALNACRKQKATLIIAKLDRLARNVAFVASLMESKVRFIAADMPEANELTIHIIAAMAQHEAQQISARTKAALAAAKARGTKLGWSMPARREEQRKATRSGVRIIRSNANRFAANVLPIVRQIEAAGVTTLDGIAQALNARGIKTARGGQWYPTTVRNLMAREQVELKAAA